MVKERRVSGGPSLIPQAQGAEIDSAALTPQSAPFLAPSNDGTKSLRLAENVDVLYGKGALKDPGPVLKTKTTVSASKTKKAPASGMIYRVTKGDTIKSISAAFGIPIDTIVEFNPSVNFSPLDPGISIIIPGQNDIALFSSQN